MLLLLLLLCCVGEDGQHHPVVFWLTDDCSVLLTSMAINFWKFLTPSISCLSHFNLFCLIATNWNACRVCSGVQPAETTRYVTCSRLFSMIWNASPVDLNFISICSLTMRRLQNFSMVQMLHIQGLLWWHRLIVHQRYSSSSEWWWFFTNFLGLESRQHTLEGIFCDPVSP